MIIQLSGSSINQKAVDALTHNNPQMVMGLRSLNAMSLSALEDGILTLLDLDANGIMQTYLAPSKLAEKLDKKDILNQVSTIQLLVSDVVPERSMLGYATELSQALLALDAPKACMILVPNALAHCMLIVPPDTADGVWTCYAKPSHEVSALLMPNADDGLSKGNFAFYQNHFTHCSFSGPIHNKLEEVASLISPETVENTYARKP